MIDQIQVLDHGYVKVVATLGSDESIVEAARMSTGKGFEGWDKDARLLEFLYKNSHMTPFEMCELVIEVQAPIFVFREWHRHRTQSYNEMSARYVQMPDVHYLPSMDRMQASRQSTKNKQGSEDGLDEYVAGVERENIEDEQKHIYEGYERMLEKGLAKEIARINTPVSRYSRMRAKANLRNWLGFLLLRLAPAAQFEIRQYAEAVAKIVAENWPRTWALFEEYDRYAVKLSRKELAILREAFGGAVMDGPTDAVLKRCTEKEPR